MDATFITLAAYDAHMLPASIASYYGRADEIIVGLDRDRLSWSGVPFELNGGELRAELRLIDPDNKIRVIERPFYRPERSPLENDSAERAYLAKLARNEWVVEVDADERLTDVGALLDAMAACPDGAQVYGVWLNVFKVIGNTALVVTPQHHTCPLATQSRNRVRARITDELPFVAPGVHVTHWSTARDEDELAQKLESWSHSTQVRGDFLDQWRSVTLDNFSDAKNLHPFLPAQWPGLRAVPLESLQCQLS